MTNKRVVAGLIVLASLGGYVFLPRQSFAQFVSYFLGGLGAGVGAAIVQALAPVPQWKAAVVCLSAAYAPCAGLMFFGFPPAHALGYALLPAVAYGPAAFILATSSSRE